MPSQFKLSKRLAQLLVLGTLAACGTESGIGPTPPGALQVSPDTLTIDTRQTVQFQAVTSGPQQGAAIAITWSADGGIITSTGLFTADSSVRTYSITAKDASGRTATANIRAVHQLRQVVLVPATASITTGGTLQFQSYGLSRSGDSVAVAPTYSATGGSITSTGLYTAGATVGTYRVIAVVGTLADTSAVTIAAAPPPPGPATVEVTPSSATFDQNTTFQFRATVRDAAGNALTGQTVAWSSANTGVATVDGTGLARGVSPGSTTVTATSGGKSGSATVTVQAPAVASVEVSPAAPSITQGSTVQLAATVRDAAGNILTGRTITWTSANSGVVTVNGSGLATGVSGGNAAVAATSEGKAGSASVTVTPPASECASLRAGWIWCDDFEQDRLSSYFEYDAAGGRFARTSGVGYAGSVGMRAHWDIGQQSAGSLHLAMGKEPLSYFRPVDAGTANYREIYWRMYVKNQAGWIGGGGDKLTRAFVFANGNWAQAAIAHVWSGISAGPDGNYLLIDPASGTDAAGNLLTTGYNDFAHLTWLGQGHGLTPIFDAAHVGQWYCVEAHAKLNTAGSSDGVFELWINSSLETQRSGLNFLGSFSDYGLNAVYFENYWNAGSVASQDRYFDNIVVSTARVGCL
ncbi:MAG: Ig-like domain-containing protein [Gemmatimonadetes bacterium]|nr:Ig-like domain-containing protein [Gemmatimonadota bacterium]